MGESDWFGFASTVSGLAGLRVHFLDRIPGSIGELTQAIRAHAARERTDLIVLDYLQLVRSGERTRSKQEDVDLIFGSVVDMARRLTRTATLVVSQLRRTRGACPTKEDLYHSGAIEQFAHTIGLLWRPEELPDFRQTVALILAKQKNGPTGRLVLGWDAERCSYADPDPFEAKRFEQAMGAMKHGGRAERGAA